MIQEIYDYLYIRSLVNSSRFDLDHFRDKEDLEIFLSRLAKYFNTGEDAFIAYTDFHKYVVEVIAKYRSEKELNHKTIYDINTILGRLNEYKLFDSSTLKNKVDNWFQNEYTDRKLPLILRNQEVVFASVMNEDTIFVILNKEYIEKNSKIKIDILEGPNPLDYTQLINLLISRYPGYFYANEAYDNAMKVLQDCLTKVDTITMTSYIKKTIRRLKKVKKEIEKTRKKVLKELALQEIKSKEEEKQLTKQLKETN